MIYQATLKCIKFLLLLYFPHFPYDTQHKAMFWSSAQPKECFCKALGKDMFNKHTLQLE